MPALTEPKVGGPPPITPLPPRRGGGNNGDDNGQGRRPSAEASGSMVRIAVYIGMCASTMTFAALASAMVVRRGLNPTDWHRLPVPPLLWINTLALILSSIVLDMAGRAFRAGDRPKFRKLWLAGTALGTWFLVGQAINWTFLAQNGFYLRQNPASAFFYVLTWAHAAHVIGAIGGLYYVTYRMMATPAIPMNRNVLEVSVIFWHFLDIMWLLLMAIFVFWA